MGTPPLQQPKPKRKYTTSEKSRASSRENLKKANQAPKWLKYRLTERRLAACYKALEKAVAELRRFDSPHYGLGFKRGTHCVSLRRSIELAGEKREQYEEHLELMRKAFAPLDDRDRKLVQAAAEAVWRRLRVYGGQGRWELYSVATVLVEFIAERERAAAERSSHAGPSGSTEPVDPILDPFGADRAVRLGLALIGLLTEDQVDQEAHRLDLRIERLLRGLTPPVDGQPFVQDAPPHATEADYDRKSAEALGNPLCSTPQVEATLNQDREPVEGTDKWQKDGEAAGGPASDPASGATGGSESRSGRCENAADLAQRGGLMRLLHQRAVTDADLSRLEGPDGKAVWTDLWLRAFGHAGENRNSKLENRGASFGFRVSNSEILAMAEITWARIQMLLQHREKEAAQVREALQASILARQAAVQEIDDCRLPIDDVSVARGPSSVAATDNGPRTTDSPFQSSIGNRQSAISLLGALAVYSCLGAIQEASKQIEAAYFRLLVALYGELPDFAFFKPQEPTMQDHMSKASRLAFEILSMKGGPLQRQKEREIRWQGGSAGRQPGGGP